MKVTSDLKHTNLLLMKNQSQLKNQLIKTPFFNKHFFFILTLPVRDLLRCVYSSDYTSVQAISLFFLHMLIIYCPTFICHISCHTGLDV